MKKDTIEVSREKIENKINEILDKEIKKYENNEFVKNCLEELKRLSAGGKRVRGYLVKLGAMLFGKNDDCYIDIAAALEIFQTAILIHDDIIDEAEERRGMETINAKYSGHFGISKAICIGDLGFFLSYRIINKLDISETLKEEISRVYSKTLYNTVNGEIIDVELPLKDINYHKKMDDKIIYDIYINKTAWYTIIGPVLIGAASASASYSDKEKLKLIKSFGANKRQILFKLVIPSSYNTIISSMKLCISMSLIGVIMGEFLVSRAGIGYLIIYGTQVFNLSLVMAGILILLIISFLLYKIITLLENKLIKKF